MEILASQIVLTPNPALLLESIKFLSESPSKYLQTFLEIILNASKRPNLKETVLVLLKYILSTKLVDKQVAQVTLKVCLQILMNIDGTTKLHVLGNCYSKILGLFYDLEMPSRYWNYITCFKVEIDQDFESPNMNKRNNALLFLSSLVVSQLQLKKSHLYLSQDHLVQEAKQILNRYMTFFAKLDSTPTTMEVICSTMNSFFTIIKECDEYALACTKLLINIREMSLSYLTPFQKRSVYRNLKVILLSCYSLPATQDLDDEIEQILLGFNVHPRELQNKQKIKRMKGNEEKDVEMEVPLPPSLADLPSQKPETLPHYDGPLQDQTDLANTILTRGISTFNHHHLTEIILECISDRDEMLFQRDLERFLEMEGIYDPTYQAPPNPADDEVMLMDIDIDAILEGVDDLDEEERKASVEGCIERMLEMDAFFNTSLKVKEVGGGNELGKDTLVSARFGWMVIVSRMMSRDLGFPKKEVVDFALKDFHKRIDLTVFWLFEEFVKGKEYEAWLKVVLEEMKTNLDPKDRIFTRFLVEVPDLPQFGLDFLYEYCKDEKR
jgi:Symplekin/PTA1 N-terminal